MKDTTRVVLVGLAMVAAVDFVGSWLHERALGAAAVQLAIAEYGAGRLGIAWSPPDTLSPTMGSIAKRVGRGAAAGALAAGALWIVGYATKSLSFRFPSTLVEAFLALLVAILAGARDELLLRGLVLRALAPWTKGSLVLVTCAAAAIARGWFVEGMTWDAAIAGACAAVAFGCIWLVDRGAWMAVGANAAFGFCTASLGIGSSRAYAIATGVIAAVAVAWWRIRRLPPQKG